MSDRVLGYVVIEGGVIQTGITTLEKARELRRLWNGVVPKDWRYTIAKVIPLEANHD